MTLEADGAGVQPESQEQTEQQTAAPQGSAPLDATPPAPELDTESREWLAKLGYLGDNGTLTPEGFVKLSKHAYNQEKLLGNAIRVPGKDATPEEREAFLNKLGRPPQADKYELAVPKDLPEELPYDGETATEFKSRAHELGLTQQQAAGLHDWYVAKQAEMVKSIGQQTQAQKVEKAKQAVQMLEREWGPIDSPSAKANLEFADRVLNEGDPETLADLQAYGLIGPNKEIFSAPLAKLFAKVGAALYKEGDVLKGNAGFIGNPFQRDAENLTEQMRIIKSNPELARSMAIAAGRKPEEVGLKS